jgi:tetratricopeptide (TPR) repeat protein
MQYYEAVMCGTGFRTARCARLLYAVLCLCARGQELPVTSLQPLLREGDSALARGDYEAARQSFEKAWQIAQEAPASSAVRYDILKRLTSTGAASGAFGEASRYLQQAVGWRESNLGPNDPKIADDLAILVNLYLGMKDFDRALVTAQRVQAMHVAAYTAESLPAADDFLRIAQIYLAEKKPKDALRPLMAAQGIRERLAGRIDPGLLPVLDRLNEAYTEYIGYGMEAVYRQALAIREVLYGKDSTELISTLDGLAYTCSTLGEYVAAEDLYARLLSLWEKLVGKDHPMVAVVLDKIVVLYAKQNKPEEAREALARSVAIRARFLAVGLSQQAADAVLAKHQGQARVLYKRALAALDPPSPANEELIMQIKKTLMDLDSSPKQNRVASPNEE